MEHTTHSTKQFLFYVLCSMLCVPCFMLRGHILLPAMDDSVPYAACHSILRAQNHVFAALRWYMPSKMEKTGMYECGWEITRRGREKKEVDRF